MGLQQKDITNTLAVVVGSSSKAKTEIQKDDDDRVEDWTPLSPRSSHSSQSGIPSSSDDDDRPMPRIEPGTWVGGVEDGQQDRHRTGPRAPSTGCGDHPRVLDRRDRDDGDQGPPRRSWKDAFLANSCNAGSKATDVVETAPRRRSRSPRAAARLGTPVVAPGKRTRAGGLGCAPRLLCLCWPRRRRPRPPPSRTRWPPSPSRGAVPSPLPPART